MHGSACIAPLVALHCYPPPHCLPHAQLVTRYSPHPRTSHALTCELRWQPPLAPLHAVHLRLAATHACPPLHVARAAGRTRKGVGTVRLVPTRMCAPHTLYACARPPRTPRVSHAPPRLPYNHAGARVQHICAPYVLNPVRRGVRCAANRRHTRRPSYACPAAVHACTGRCRSACACSPHGAARTALLPATAHHTRALPLRTHALAGAVCTAGLALRCYPPPHCTRRGARRAWSEACSGSCVHAHV